MRISNHNDANYLGRFKKYSFDAFPNVSKLWKQKEYGNKKNKNGVFFLSKDWFSEF